MIVVLAVAALAVFAVLALRFGRDSRERYSSPEHALAGYGVTWDDRESDRGDRGSVAGHPYPTLALIEQALGGNPGALTSDPNAAALEVRARELLAEYWSDSAWTTGIVPQQAFDRVISELAPFLAPKSAEVADVSILVAREHATVASAA